MLTLLLWVSEALAQDTLRFTMRFGPKDYEIVSEAGYDRIIPDRYGLYATGNPGTIRLALPPENEGNVRLSLYDASGRLEALIYEGELEAGYHDFKLNKELSSGAYIIRLEVEERSISKKLIIR